MAYDITTLDALCAQRLNLDFPLQRELLERAQLEQVRQILGYAQRNSPYYRDTFHHLVPESVQTRSDLELLPFLTSSELTQFGDDLLCTARGEVARIISLHTSGSTGKPKRIHFTAADLQQTMDFFLVGMHNLVSAGQSVLVVLPFTLPDSTGDLLIRALAQGGIEARGLWPMPAACELADQKDLFAVDCIAGLPHDLLRLAETVNLPKIRTMLLCSDYAAPALRQRIEKACGCTTFLHYGTTESGLGGAVECQAHQGCHIRESDLLIEIIDPRSGRHCVDGEPGEVVLTTLSRKAMPLIRYRTGDLASLDRRRCACGGRTARLTKIRDRLSCRHFLLSGELSSPDCDDILFHLKDLLDYRLSIEHGNPALLHVEWQAGRSTAKLDDRIVNRLCELPVIHQGLSCGALKFGTVCRVQDFAASHTIKRTILDISRRSTDATHPSTTR